MLTGSCLCGGVVWKTTGPLELMHHCHCGMCRKFHGTAFATAGAVPAEGFRFVSGTDRIARYESSPGAFRAFCSRCGSPVPGDPIADQLFIPVGNLDGDPGVRAIAHIFVASKAPWHEISDDLPCFDEYPPGYETPTIVARPRPAARPGMSAGSCLCGAVTYEIEGEVSPIRSCHCSRCRKAQGAAHASNTFVSTAAFRWLSGENRIVSWKLPEAKRFRQHFCSTCGSAVPRAYPELDRVVVPAGSLDSAPGAHEGVHIFVTSKAPWFEITDGRPQYAGYPPE